MRFKKVPFRITIEKNDVCDIAVLASLNILFMINK